MHTTLAQLILHEQKIAYIVIDAQLAIIEWGGKLTILSDSGEMPADLLELLPELTGCEEILQEILAGSLPSFQLENLNRSTATEEICYSNVLILRYIPQETESPLLLVILVDTTALSQTQQTLMQQRNELSLLKKSLTDTNRRLEFILQRYVPREVGEALMENRIIPELGGEVRKITVLFADLRNYTGISEKLTPTETIEMLHVCLNIASTAIAEAGGVIVNFMGDAVMAIFNAPNDQIDHAKRAVQAGLNMQAMSNCYQQQPKICEKIPPFHFGVGINTGLALVGNIGAQWHYQYTAVGDTINVASRICSYAQPQEVLIGANTYADLQGSITAEALAPVKLKGKSEEIIMYRVQSLKSNNLHIKL